MRKRCLWALIILLLLLVVSVGLVRVFATPKRVEQLANHFLAPHYHIELADDWQWKATGLTLPELKVKTDQCTLINLNDAQLTWWNTHSLDIEKASLNYDCLTHLPSDNAEKTPPNLTALWAALPISDVKVKHFQLTNTDALKQAALQPFLSADWALDANYNGNQLALEAQANNDGLELHHQSTVTPRDGIFQWTGNTDIKQSGDKTYDLQFTANFEPDLSQLPQQGNVLFNWNNPELAVTKGEAKVSWQGADGQLNAQDLTANSPLLDVPFVFTKDGLDISWGKFYWTFDSYQPIKGFLGLSIHRAAEGLLPLSIDMNVILQTFGEMGKGEIVISGKNGEIGGGDDNNELDFELKTRGDLRYNSTVALTNLTYHLGGIFTHPVVYFYPGSVFKMDNEQEGTKLHVRLPLDDIIIGRYGLEGRLQATLNGTTPQFENLNLKLDGNAHEFIAGIKTVFDFRDEEHKLQSVEKQATNRWDWIINGSANWKSLNTPVKMEGKGFWEADHIELNQLSAHSKEVKMKEVKMAPLSLELKDRLRWDYEEEHIRGLLQAKTDWIELAYGGRFVSPVFGLGIDGKSISNFNFAGDLKAGSLGPLDVLGVYQNSALSGEISWKEQSAKVFQSLFPQKWNWLIHEGSIKGQSKFVINTNGVKMGGELNLKNGKITMPDGEVYGLNIRFPMNYENEALQVASGKPIHISTKNIRYGVLSVANGELDLFGRYPNTMKNPLILKNVKVSLFDGELTVPQLTFPQSKMATLSFTNIDLDQVLALAQYNQVTLTGRANATLPFWLGHKECLICNGTLEQVGNVSIKLTDEMVKGLKKGGWTENILVDLLKEMELQNSHAAVTLDPKGQMTLRASISGFNPTKRTNNPITLNYTHQENMFELWNMIDYGSQFEQNLQYKLYKQLDKTNDKTP